MKRIAWIVGAVAVAALALLALLIVLLPRESLKTGIGEQIAAWTGRDVSLRGEPELSLFPDLTVTLKDVQVGGPSGMDEAEIVSMDRLTGEIRLLPLVIGRVEIGAYRMVRPLIRLVRDDTGARNWAFDSGAAALQLAFAGDVPLGNFVMEDGTFIYQNRRDGVIERLDSVNLTVEWPSVRQPFVVSGSGIWRGEQVSFSATAGAPFEFIKGKATPLEAKLDSVPLAMAFSGTAADLDTPRMNGELSLATPSLRGFAAWLGSPIGPGSTLGQASLSGTAVYSEGVLSVENAELALDGNNAAGALKVSASAKPDVTGTLAFPALDLTPYFAGIATAWRGGDWRSIDLATGWFEDLSADIRLSAGSVQLGGIRFGQTAASASLREARLEIGLAEAAFSGGTLSGDVALTHSAATLDAAVEAQLRATDFDLAAAALALGLPPMLAGSASIAVDFAGSGKDFGSLVAGMRGTSVVSLRNGAVPLFGIAALAAGAAAAPAVDPSQPTPVDELAARLSFAGGTANLDDAKIVAPGFSAEAAGRMGLLDGSLGIDGTIRPAAAATPIPFAIGGTLARPLARPLPPTN
jgi:AsmA protein